MPRRKSAWQEMGCGPADLLLLQLVLCCHWLYWLSCLCCAPCWSKVPGGTWGAGGRVTILVSLKQWKEAILIMGLRGACVCREPQGSLMVWSGSVHRSDSEQISLQFLIASQEWGFLSSTSSLYLKPHLKTGLCTFLFTVIDHHKCHGIHLSWSFYAKWITFSHNVCMLQ